MTVDTAAGHLRVHADDVELVIADQTVTADLVLERSLDAAGAGRSTVTVSDAAFAVPGLSLTEGAGTLVATAAGRIPARCPAGSPWTCPGSPCPGTLALSLDSVTGDISFVGTGITVTVLGQQLTGDLTVEQTTGGAGPVTTVTVAGAGLSLGGGLLSVTGGQAHLVLEAGSLTSLTVSGSVALNVPGVSLTGTVSAAVSGGSVVVTVTAATITAGGFSFHADVEVTSSTDASGARTLTIEVTDDDGEGGDDFLH